MVLDSTPPPSPSQPRRAASPGAAVLVAADAGGVAGVQFKLDNTINLGVEDISPPYSVIWNTTTATDGSSHTLTALARDAANNMMTSGAIKSAV